MYLADTIVANPAKVHDDGIEPLYLTKGDNNFFDDRSLYSPNTFFLRRRDILGKSIFIVRWVGMVGRQKYLSLGFSWLFHCVGHHYYERTSVLEVSHCRSVVINGSFWRMRRMDKWSNQG